MSFEHDQPFQFQHVVYFTVADRSPSTLNAYSEACVEYLSRHEGQVYFSLAVRALEMRRDVSDTSFDVAMVMIFDRFASYDLYRKHPRHEAFITRTAGMTTSRRVFDSYITYEQSAVNDTEARA